MTGPRRTILALALTLVAAAAPPLPAQSAPPSVTKKLPAAPAIGSRSFGGGSAEIDVTGAIRIDADVAINKEASYGDGEMTWLQFGVSGAAEPNALITYGEDGEVGVTVGLGRKISTAGGADCSGETTVSAAAVAGRYTCRGVTSYDPTTGKMGTVAIAIRFRAFTAKP